MGIGFWVCLFATLIGASIDCFAWKWVLARSVGFILVICGLTGMTMEAIEQDQKAKKAACELGLKIDLKGLSSTHSDALLLTFGSKLRLDTKEDQSFDERLNKSLDGAQKMMDHLSVAECTCDVRIFGETICSYQKYSREKSK